jgi:hypothetical protein
VSALVAQKKRELMLQSVPVPEPWTAAVIPVSAFPVPEDERLRLREGLAEWCALVAGTNELTATTWLQMNHMHLDQGAPKLSTNGRTWLPMTGLGIWPDREPPRLWTKADFADREYGQPLPPLMHTVFHISRGAEASNHARDVMIGSGTVVHALLKGDSGQYHEAMRELLLPPITEEALRGHPFYMPLLEARSLRNVTVDVLDAWMGSARVYLRESVEDGGVLIVCSVADAIGEWTRLLEK